MNVTNTTRRVAVQVSVRLFMFVYVGAFAGGGYLVWNRITGLSLFSQHTPVTGPWYAQMAAGFHAAMVLVGPALGILVGTALMALYLRRTD